jgi:hypothetical protein
VLSALEGTSVPHPKPVALCEDPSVAGGVAYLMEHVDGFAPAFVLPEPFASDEALRRAIPLAAMGALGELARVDWRARGLEDFGRPEGARRSEALAREGSRLADPPSVVPPGSTKGVQLASLRCVRPGGSGDVDEDVLDAERELGKDAG